MEDCAAEEAGDAVSPVRQLQTPSVEQLRVGIVHTGRGRTGGGSCAGALKPYIGLQLADLGGDGGRGQWVGDVRVRVGGCFFRLASKMARVAVAEVAVPAS